MLKPLASLLVLLLAACATQIGTRNSTDERLTMFSQIVFAPDYDSRRVDYLGKWTGPVNIAMEGRNEDSYRNYLRSQVSSLSKTTDLDIAMATESRPANVTVYFAAASELPTMLDRNARNATAAKNVLAGSGCYHEIDKDAGHRIVRARLFVLVDPNAVAVRLLTGSYNTNVEKNEQDRVRLCVIEGTIRMLGLTNSSDVIVPSIFNTTHALTQPTTLDLKMMKALYAPALKPGMSRREALAAAQPLLK